MGSLNPAWPAPASWCQAHVLWGTALVQTTEQWTVEQGTFCEVSQAHTQLSMPVKHSVSFNKEKAPSRDLLHCKKLRWQSSGQWCRGVTLCEQLVAAQSRLYLGNLQLSSPHPHILPTDGVTLNWRAQDCKTNTPHKSPKPSPPERCKAQSVIGWSCHRLLLGVRGWDCVDTIWIVDDLLPKMLMVTPLWPLDNNDPTSLQGTMTVIDPEPELGGGGRSRATISQSPLWPRHLDLCGQVTASSGPWLSHYEERTPTQRPERRRGRVRKLFRAPDCHLHCGCCCGAICAVVKQMAARLLHILFVCLFKNRCAGFCFYDVWCRRHSPHLLLSR